jgi:GT2 family glycosyltransferase
MANPKVSVIILNWNRKDDTIETLKSLNRSNTSNFELNIIVVDNGSKDESVEALNKITNIKFRLIALPENTGFVMGNNIGMKAALDEENADYILTLNDDTLVDKNMIKNMIKYAEEDKNVGVCVPKIYFAPGFEFKDKYPRGVSGKVIWYAGGKIDWDNVYGSNFGVDDVDRGQYDEIKETDFATGCALLAKRKVIEKIGMFDEKFFAYMEDLDFSRRAMGAGYKVVYVPDAYMWHKVSQSSGIGSELNDYYITRNRMIIGMRYAKPRTKFALLRESVKLLFFGRKWQRIGIKDYYLRKFGKGSWK